MAKPLVSFIIPYYNLPADMLCQCIDSILALTLAPSEREVIIVDDGSGESPVDQLMQYNDEITYIRQRHAGPSEARNKGLQMATGQYLQFVDADDLLIGHAYEHCVQIARNQSPEMVVFDFTTTPHADTKAPQDHPIQSGCHYMRHHNIHGASWGYLFKRSILGDLRFTPGIYHEDEEFTALLMLRAETLCLTSAQAYCYQERTDSRVRNNNQQQITQRLHDLKGVIHRLHIAADRRPIDDKTALQRRVAQLTMDYIYQVIWHTHSRQQLESEISELTSKGLFPLPAQNYTAKYTWFRRLSATSVGRALLMRIIPLTHKER
jgi:glycosyltransferase involved in cell wall biosynthesis